MIRPGQYQTLMDATRYVDHVLWDLVLPWLEECRTGHAALVVVISLDRSGGLSQDGLEEVVAPLLERFSLQALATSRFPLFGLLAHALELNAPDESPRPCRADLALYFRAVLAGSAALDGRLVSELAADEAAPQGVCSHQLAMTAAALGGFPLRPLANRSVIQAWCRPTPWPVWSALHTRWRRAPQLPSGQNPVPLSLSPLRGFRSSRWSFLEARLRSFDFNGWSIPGTPMESLAAPEAQDDGWTLEFDQELERRRNGGTDDAGTVRVAFLESEKGELFDGAMNMDHRPPQQRGANAVVHRGTFEEQWRRFMINPDDQAVFSTCQVGYFDKRPLGLMTAWHADFVHWPLRPTTDDIQALANYDIVIVFDAWPLGRPPELPLVRGQVRLWMPWEPVAIEGDVSFPDDYCPVVLDLFAVASVPSALVWYHFWIQQWRDTFPAPPPESGDGPPEALVFYYVPERTTELASGLRSMGYEVTHAMHSSWKRYWRSLQGAFIAILPAHRGVARLSPGQVIADAAMANCVPTFSPRTKLLARLLLPAFLSYRSHEELMAKAQLLRDHPEWRQTLSREVCRRLRYIDGQSIETPLQLLQRVSLEAPGD
ncbi:unnamed protein product, partial [Prorocentrum cordatum]